MILIDSCNILTPFNDEYKSANDHMKTVAPRQKGDNWLFPFYKNNASIYLIRKLNHHYRIIEVLTDCEGSQTKSMNSKYNILNFHSSCSIF